MFGFLKPKVKIVYVDKSLAKAVEEIQESYDLHREMLVSLGMKGRRGTLAYQQELHTVTGIGMALDKLKKQPEVNKPEVPQPEPVRM